MSGDAIVDSENKFDRCCLGIFCIPLCTIPFLGQEVLRKYLPNSAQGGCLLALFVMFQAAGIPKTPHRHRRQQKNSRNPKAVSHSKRTHAVFVRSNYTKPWRVWLCFFPYIGSMKISKISWDSPLDPDPKGLGSPDWSNYVEPEGFSSSHCWDQFLQLKIHEKNTNGRSCIQLCWLGFTRAR